MANEEIKKLSTDDIQEVATEDSVEFAIARIAVLSTRPNSHKMKITEDVLREYSPTMLGKWVVAEYSKWRDDVTTHTKNQNILGIIPKDQEVEFVRTEDGYLVAYVKAVLSKIYATEEYKLFTKDNFRNISIEMGVKEKEIEDEYFETEVEAFCCYGVTVLGKTVNPSCADAHIEITQFSEQNATDYFTKERALRLSEELKSFAESLDSKDNNDERTNPMEIENLAQLSEDENKEDIVMSKEEPKEEPKSEESKKMAEPKEEEPKSEDKKEMSEPTQMAEEPKEDVEDDKDDDDDDDKDGKDEDKDATKMSEEKKFSLEQFASDELIKSLSDEMAELVKMESADDVIKKFAEIMEQNSALVAKNSELESFKTEKLSEERDNKVKAILAKVKEDLPVEQFSELSKESESVKLDEIDAFENKVKAFAYEASKSNVTKENEVEDGVMHMASSAQNVVSKDEDIFARLSRKYN